MKYWIWLLGFIWMTGCSQKKIESPEGTGFSLQMATEGVGRFEEYIHDLNIYAFRKTAEGSFVYSRTLAILYAEDIARLEDGSAKGDSKWLNTSLAVGTYEIYAVANAAGYFNGKLTENVTTPEELTIAGPLNGQDSVYFLGHTLVQVITEYMTPVKINLSRAVSKLVLVLYDVPVQIKAVKMSLSNIARKISINGKLSSESKIINQDFKVLMDTGSPRDTIVGEIITLPSLAGGAEMQLTFYAENGQEKVKKMPVQYLLPDKYVRVTGRIDDSPGALLSFEVRFRLFLFDYWLDKVLPDFVLNKEE